MIKAGNAEIAHVPERLIDLTIRGAFSLLAMQSCTFAVADPEQQQIPGRNRELFLPAMALSIRGHKSVGHLVFLRRRGFQTASIHLRDVGLRVLCEGQRFLLGLLVECGIDLVCFGGNLSTSAPGWLRGLVTDKSGIVARVFGFVKRGARMRKQSIPTATTTRLNDSHLLDEMRIDDSRPQAQGYWRKTTPFFITKLTCSQVDMSSSGFPGTAMMSAK